MKAVSDLLGANIDADGIAHVNQGARGCPYCGSTDAKTYEKDGIVRAVFYHAAAECCVRRLDDQVRWRDREAEQLQERLDESHEAMNQLARDADEAYGNQKVALEKKLERARNGMKYREKAIKDRMDVVFDERAALVKKRGWMQRKEGAA